MNSLRITGEDTDALLDAVAMWDLSVDMGYPFVIKGSAQELVMVMMTFAGDDRPSRALVEELRDRAVIISGADEGQLELMFTMTNVILP